MKTCRVASVNVSSAKGTSKRPVDVIELVASGVSGDAHAGTPNRGVSLLTSEIISAFGLSKSRAMVPGDFAENITLEGLDLGKVAVLDRFTNESVELEVTQIGKECHGDGCSIFREVGECVMPHEGLFCRVLKPGTLRAGDILNVVEMPFRVLVMTLSDRASRGEYADRSGPAIRAALDEFMKNRRWHTAIESCVIPDDREALLARLVSARAQQLDVVITTGGTGVSPRDITPDVVAPMLDRQIPGIMENIRIKFGASHPNALLSRGVAGVMGSTLVYTLPGSVRAATEYIGEILKTLEHLIFMLHSLDPH